VHEARITNATPTETTVRGFETFAVVEGANPN